VQVFDLSLTCDRNNQRVKDNGVGHNTPNSRRVCACVWKVVKI